MRNITESIKINVNLIIKAVQFVRFDHTLFTMNAPTSRQVLQLYRKLMRYGQNLKFTDQEYFRRRIRKEFRINKELQSQADIEFNIKVIHYKSH